MTTAPHPRSGRLALPWNPIADRGNLPLYDVVERAWTAGARPYHGLAHLEDLLERCGEVERDVGWRAPVDVFLAALFHDAVYEPGARDNEARSAALAAGEIAREPRLADADAARVVHLIEVTARHGSHAPRDDDDDESLFLDADMSILGAPPERYDQYAAHVRKEYAEVPDEAYAAGRGRFLEGVLASSAVFVSPYFRARLEVQARDNLTRELARLR